MTHALLVAALLLVNQGPLTLPDVLDSADAHHPMIAVALAEQAAARGELMAQEGQFDPSLRARALGEVSYYESFTSDIGVDVPTPLWGASVSGGWRTGLGDFPVYDGKLKTNDWGELRLGLLVPLLRDGWTDRRRAGIAKSEIEQLVQEQAVRLARLEIRRAAALAYWEWVAARARAAIAEEQLQLAETRDQQLRERASSGDVAAIEQQDNVRLVAQRRARLVGATRATERAALELAIFVRDADGAPVVVESARAPVLALPEAGLLSTPYEALEQEARAARPELIRLARAQQQVSVDQRLAENQLLPGIALSASASQDLGPTSPPRSSSSSVWAPDPKTRDVPDVEVGLSFELPIPLRQARGRLAATEAQRARLDQAARLAGDRVSLEVKDALSAANAALARSHAATDEVAAASQVENAERSRFGAGDSTLLIVNLRESATADARLALVDAMLDARRAEVAILATTARLLDGPPGDARP